MNGKPPATKPFGRKSDYRRRRARLFMGPVGGRQYQDPFVVPGADAVHLEHAPTDGVAMIYCKFKV